jgi:hypothetical protein
MRNGMWVRSALMAAIFGCDRDIRRHYAENVGAAGRKEPA